MSETQDNKSKLKAYFGNEYKALKAFVNSKISESADRDAEDIIQDVALKLFSRDSTSPINNVAGFVYSSIRNRIIDIMRSKKQRVDKNLELENHPLEIIENLQLSDDDSYTEKLQHELKTAISSLKPHYREIIIAVDFEGYTYKELSLETGIPEGTLMSRRHRALALLHQKLTKKINEN